MVVELNRDEARRIAVRAQLLALPRPSSVDAALGRLTFLQYDQTAAVAPSADLVLWSRLGSSYRPAMLADGLADRTYVELRGLIRPMDDIPLFRAEMAAHQAPDSQFGSPGAQHWVDANDRFRRDVLDRLDRDGPLPQSEIPDTSQVPWGSSGWNNNRNVGMMLECLVVRGEIALADRDGRDRMWDLARRVYPAETIPYDEAMRIRAERRLGSLGIARPFRDLPASGIEARVDGVRGKWRVDPAQLGQPFDGRTVLLSPLDRLIFDRKRMVELFEFDYNLEMYKPAAARRWGYWAMPILHHDRLIGKLDATADRRHGVLRVDAIHEDEPFPAKVKAAVRAEIRDLAQWLGLGLDLPA
ncbi:winged helix DNA-binding domain-containing protein [Actinoplanes bogorensis]|uniref:Winged helix DNA-binding domain-containing protein n=1 Tax=Paractinoplanes bogorensis TaxID=1610840 RepID=A0ABS5YL27_9ACTN|nr:crosslink repair DNA glycosylase YcaQ family protein [Actinoplanes bogorensis]MBU2662655.1 winged helix DNA-binding domain-containing protein [Actinoplanes bogorensis]